ncbi:MAG TPA: MiaB/RimO family radical SAM methylthiotransferase [bacterium]|nr:MiaB/RimO family radical SAM methylthiotransferase [bacterium]
MATTLTPPAEAGAPTPTRKPRYYLKTFGCQMNVADSAGFADVLEARGFEPTGDPADADIALVNTCTIREKAEEKAYTFLGQLESLSRRRSRKQGAPLRVALVGCLTHQVEDSIRSRFPSIAFTLRPDQADSFEARLTEVFPEAFRSPLGNEFEADGEYFREITGRLAHGTYAPGDRHRFVNVMRGCEKMCTFCIVPMARGANFSYPVELIRTQVERYAFWEGAKVITLLGQSILDYGKDRPVKEGVTPNPRGDQHFRELVVELATLYPSIWFKFLTSHPHDLTRETIDAFAGLPNVSKYFHLPLQAGDNTVLKRMARRYSVGQYEEIAGYLRERIPGARLSTDLICGFVGETEEQFQNTIAACERIRFEKAYTFYYTARPGTYADGHWPDTLSEGEKKERLQRLIEVTNAITLERHRALEGRILPVLVEGAAQREEGMVVGRSKEEDVVVFPGDIDTLMGKIVDVRIVKGNLRVLVGEAVNPVPSST